MSDPEPAPRYPIRQKSARGMPRPLNQFTRRCRTCGACFLGLAAGKTGERGIWTEWAWFCSVECAPASQKALEAS